LYRATDKEYISLERMYGDTNIKGICIECGQEAHVRNRHIGMESRNIVSDERGDNQYPRGFAHYEDNRGVDCADYTGGYELLDKFRQDSEFDYLERQRNLAVLHNPAIRREIDVVDDFFLKILRQPKTVPGGEASLDIVITQNQDWRLNASDRDQLGRMRLRVASMVGLAQEPWVYGIAGPILIGSAQKLSINGALRRVEYDLKGDMRDYPIEHCFDGGRRVLRIKDQIVMCWSNRSGRRTGALRRGGEKDVAFGAVPAFVESIVAKRLGIPRDDVLITEAARRRHRQNMAMRTEHLAGRAPFSPSPS